MRQENSSYTSDPYTYIDYLNTSLEKLFNYCYEATISLKKDMYLLFTLYKLSLQYKMSACYINALLKINNINTNFSKLLDKLSIEALSNDLGMAKQDLNFMNIKTAFGKLQLRGLTLIACTNKKLMSEISDLPFRTHFTIPAALFDFNMFVLHELNHHYRHEKQMFKSILSDGNNALFKNTHKLFKSILSTWRSDKSVEWHMSKLVYSAFAMTFFDIPENQLMKQFENLNTALNAVETQWQNTSQYNAFKTYQLIKQLNGISEILHACRKVNPDLSRTSYNSNTHNLADKFADNNHNNKINIPAIFLVTKNLVRLLSATIILACTDRKTILMLQKAISNIDSNKSPDEVQSQISKEAIFWKIAFEATRIRFRDSMIFRPNNNLVFNAFFNWGKQLTLQNDAILPRTVLFLPQGHMNASDKKWQNPNTFNLNRKEYTTNNMHQFHKIAPEAFGPRTSRRTCPGRNSSYTMLLALLYTVAKSNHFFNPSVLSQAETYKAFVLSGSGSPEGRATHTKDPDVCGNWMTM